MTTPDLPPETNTNAPADPAAPESSDSSAALSAQPDASMQEYYKLQNHLLLTTLVMAAVIFSSVWAVYSLNIALNYLIGACTGVVYLRMLARNVEQLGREKGRIGNTRLVLLVGLILIASRWNQLQIMPIFLGFLTYKAAVILYMLRTSILPSQG
ncbi:MULTISPECIES: ATP synthase subunit I [Thermoleptolyngbya]